MKRLLVAGLAAAAVTALVPAPASAAFTSCTGVPAKKITSLKADGVGCAKARKVAKGWDRTGPSHGFECGYYPITNDKQIEKVRCAKDEKVVKFKKRWMGEMPFPTFPPIQLPSANSGP
jgi:hypothetical protein